MAVSFLGIRYIMTSAGNMGCAYFEVSTPHTSEPSQNDFRTASTANHYEGSLVGANYYPRSGSAVQYYIDGVTVGDSIIEYHGNSSDVILKIMHDNAEVGRLAEVNRSWGSIAYGVPVIVKYTDGYVLCAGRYSGWYDNPDPDISATFPSGNELGYIVSDKANVGLTVTYYGTAYYNLQHDNIGAWLEENPPSPTPLPTDTDPYSQGGNSGTGGGTGTFSDTGDIIGIPSLPTLSAVDTGFITLFNPSASDIKALANYMWSSSFDLSLFKNIVANPIECILGLTIVPVNPYNAGTKTLTVGNIPTDVSMPYLSSQYVEVDCGTLNIAEFWGSYLDYSPYTKIQLYLPYIGIVPVDIDDIQNSTIKVVYHVDVLSGACVAYVLCGGTQLYTYIGQCSSNIPVTSNDFTNTLNGILGIAGNIGSLVSGMASSMSPPASGGGTGSSLGAGGVGNIISAGANIASNAVNAFKPNIQKSGALSGTGGMLGVQTPYLICQRPRQSVPERQNHFTGYPSNITYTLSDLTGYTEVQSVHLDNVPCTDAEMGEILEYLIGGVVI